MLIKLNEDSRNKLLSKAKQGANYKTDQSKGRNRYERRTKSKISNSVKEYNRLNMNKFFKEDILDLNILVHGETDDYLVGISFSGILELIREETEKNQDIQVDLRLILQMLKRAFNREDHVLVKCQCLHPDTKIKLLDGTCPTVSEMCDRYNNGEQMYVYSVDEKGDFKPGVVECVWKTGVSSSFIKVTLDNGEHILTTPEHLYMMRTGEFIQAQDLSVGDSLMPMYFNSTNGYETVKFNSEVRGWHSVYKLVAEYFKNNEILDTEKRASDSDNMSYKVAIHHADFNKKNNNPENLKIMTAREHWDYHASLGWNSWSDERKKSFVEMSRKNAIKRNENPTLAMIESRKQFTMRGMLRNYDEDRKEQQREMMRKVSKSYWENITKEEYEDKCKRTSEYLKNAWKRGCFNTSSFVEASKKRGEFLQSDAIKKLSADGVRKYWETISEEERARRNKINKENLCKAVEKVKGSHFTNEHKQKISESKLNKSDEEKKEIANKINTTKIRNILQYLIDNRLELSLENYEIRRKQLNGYPKITTYYKSIDDAVSSLMLNHKIVSIERIETESTPVYDIKVKDFQNFVVNAGVVLHNCPDWKYRMAYFASVNDIILGEKETIKSDKTNPDDKLGPACKHVILVLSNNSWIVKLASAINNYINYIKDHYEKNYAEIIFPQLYGIPYDDYVQLGLFDKDELDNTMDKDKDELDKLDTTAANEYGRTRTQFKKGNQSGIQFARNPEITDDDQLELDLR